MNFPIINIHTHKPCAENAICISNLFPDRFSKLRKNISGFFSVGIHPWYVKDKEYLEKQLSLLQEAVSHPKCLAIGECGLDKVSKTPWDLQKQAFVEQIKISEKEDKPVIIHCVKTWDDILQMRKNENARKKWIIHGFNSSTQMARQLIDSGCMLSFGSIILKSDSKAANVLSELDFDDFFLETDDIDIGIEKIYEKASEIRNESIDNLKSKQYNNFERVFGKLSQ